ncbi:DUF6879 family protein [Streptomyces turgidiscabies]|uniref:DUF6879 domain-containing protein n=1 Tax=Streptomyces turgidiscabies (strain Car8) TaxID=698760 RepID=L7F8R0_STRT8|nr:MULTISPECIES: DUF6879 family protein [Streptomyces]ELP67060.1 hypothetical protein STRTUCAR8_04309 [Streptomyces turgidiscabies Car8]MDX3495989.1 hypothetical protein [Streptomyces turgidiscabies]GAQ72521.1 hypothetical protein T45_04273 [Streptomyces turgidiscabies]
MSQNVPSFDQLMEATQRSAVHLEMRDQYAVGDEADDFNAWLHEGRRDADPASEYWTPWVDMISRAVARGVVVRRARIVSEPVTDYIRYEYAGTDVNVHAGEQVRWLPRQQVSDLMLPGADLWIFDGTQVLFNHFSGDGDWSDPPMELRTEPSIVKQCSDAFDAVWERAVPHDEYEIR